MFLGSNLEVFLFIINIIIIIIIIKHVLFLRSSLVTEITQQEFLGEVLPRGEAKLLRVRPSQVGKENRALAKVNAVYLCIRTHKQLALSSTPR